MEIAPRENKKIKNTGVQAHKDYLKQLQTEMQELREKFENGTLQDYENDRMDILAKEIRVRETELRGLI